MPIKTTKKRMPAAAETPSQTHLGWLGGTIGFNLRIAQEASVRTYLRSVADTGTLQWRFAILALIHENPGMTQAALGKAIKRDTSSLTPALDDLCERGLVTRVRRENDRRSYELRLTARGRTTMEQMKVKVQAHEEELDQLITKDQRARLIAILRQITTGLSSDE
ncbi:MAG TPA: MarR family transcriptional regulator [Beijerinckiaceae bacterium]|jgi:DNA-binding MarR family transcriptional regulator|nr:MarR family transcriptional regulator [Beijerinckiaceae bacterium]